MRIHRNVPLGCLVSFCIAAPVTAQKKMDLDELLARHAAFLKKTETPPLKSRVLEGEVSMTIIVGGSGTLVGTWDLASEGEKRRLGMKFGNTSYDHELIVSNGDKISVDNVNPARRSDLGQFLLAQDQVFKEGLFGGVLSAAWPLASSGELKSRLKYEGLKKIDGRELHVVKYRTERKGGDLDITLYFDAQTYCHVKTSYLLSTRAGIVSTPGVTEQMPSRGAGGEGAGSGRVETGETATARQDTHRIRLEEEFDDFRNSQGYAVPAKWKIRLTTQTDKSRIWEWQVNVLKVTNNAPVETAQFAVK